MKYHVIANGTLKDISLSTIHTYYTFATFESFGAAQAWAHNLLWPYFIVSVDDYGQLDFNPRQPVAVANVG